MNQKHAFTLQKKNTIMKRKFYLAAAISSLISMTSLAQYPTNGLIGYYPFNATIEDASDNNIDMISPSAPGYFSDRFNSSNSCYESGSGANIPNIQNSANISFSVWVNPLSIDDYYPAIFSRVFYLFDGTSNVGKIGNYMLYLEPSALDNKFGVWMECHQGVASQTATTYEYLGAPVAIDVAEWSHIVVTVEGTDAKMYINGTLSASKTLEYAMVAIAANDPGTGVDQVNDFVLGKSKKVDVNSGSYSDYLNLTGFIDDIFIYDRALTAAEVTTLYTLPQNPSPAGASINENDLVQLAIYPNPAKNEIKVSNLTGEFNYEIISMAGQTLAAGKTTSNQSIATEYLSNGVYFVKIQQNNATQTIKFIKE